MFQAWHQLLIPSEKGRATGSRVLHQGTIQVSKDYNSVPVRYLLELMVQSRPKSFTSLQAAFIPSKNMLVTP